MIRKIVTIGGVAVLMFAMTITAWAVGIDTTNGYAWGENIGWINFASTEGGVDIGLTELTGYAWGENVGWISLNCSNTGTCGTVNYKVSREALSGGLVDLTGYAWGENVGWISFNCDNTSSCGTSNYKTTINASTGDFTGYAWGENIGWIVFNCSQTSSCGTVNYKVATAGGASIPGAGSSGGSRQVNLHGGATPSALPMESSSPTPTPTATPTPTPTNSETPSPTPTPSVSVTPSPQGTPVPVAPSSPPPPVSPPGLPPPYVSPGAGGFNQAVDSVAGFIDRISRTVFAVITPALVTTASGIVTAVAAVPIAVALATAVAQNEAAALSYHTLVIFGLRRRAKVWGTVYDSQTKHPIPLAKLQLLDANGHVLETRFADRDGRYGFLTSPSSLQQTTLAVKIVASKEGYQFPSHKISLGVDFVVYDHVYFGDLLQLQSKDSYLSYNIPMDPVGAQTSRIASAFGFGLVGTVSDKLLNIGFILGLFILPLNYFWSPSLPNLLLLLLFLIVNGIRSFAVYRPYGVIKDARTNQPLPFSLITLNDMQGKRVAFAVSDEYGRYFLSAERGTEYQCTVYTPANILPQRTKSIHIASHSYSARRAWVTLNISL